MAHTVSDDWVWSWPTTRGEMGRGVRIELAPRLVRPWCWLAWGCCWCGGCGGGGVPACWGGRCHLVSYDVVVPVTVAGFGGCRVGFGMRCRCRSVVVGVVVGRGVVVAIGVGKKVLSGGGDGSLSSIDRSRDAPAQGFSARAAGAAAGQGDNDKDLGGQGAIMMGAFPSLRLQDFQYVGNQKRLSAAD